MNTPWWIRWAGRLEYELAELEKNGIKYTRDEAAFERGVLVLHLKHKVGSENIELRVTFPDFYPYFRFEVVAENLNLIKHQNPFGKNLCLIGRSTSNWDSRYDCVAKFIIEQLPKVLQAQSDRVGFEERQGEPISVFYNYSESVIFIDSSWSIRPEMDRGRMVLGIRNGDLSKLAVLKILDSSDHTLIEQGENILADLYNVRLNAQWVRIANPIIINNPEKYYSSLVNQFPHLSQVKPSWSSIKGEKGAFAFIGVTFPEELQYGMQGDGWLFIRIHKINKKERNYDFVRAGRAGLGDLLARIPNSVHLKNKKVAIVGLGSIGAPSAIEFARNCFQEIRILDHDYLEPGNAVRWPLGFTAVPYQKVKALGDFISTNYPYTKVIPLTFHLGGISNGRSQQEVLEKFIDGVDLVYDATAEFGVHHLLADFCRDKKLPLVIASATHGAWGGFVARFIPGQTCCWQCFEGARPSPPENQDDRIQPVGCADPTFTGANFDLQEIVLAGVRLTVATLLRDIVSGVDFDWDAANVSLRKNGGVPTLPEWHRLDTIPYSDCNVCKRKL